MSLTIPIATERSSQLSPAHSRLAAPVLRPTVVGLIAWVALTALLASALVALSLYAPEALHRALDGLIPMDPTAFSGFTT